MRVQRQAKGDINAFGVKVAVRQKYDALFVTDGYRYCRQASRNGFTSGAIRVVKRSPNKASSSFVYKCCTPGTMM